jgi:hypothetical protein
MSVIFIILCFNWFHKRINRQNIGDNIIVEFPIVGVTKNIYTYVLGTILNQGKHIIFNI